MQRFYLYFFALLVFASNGFGQTKGFEPGFIVTNSGDTLRGEIKYKSNDEIKDKITLKTSEEDKKIFKASDILSFSAGEHSFITYEIDGAKVFLMEWAMGPLELFEHQLVNETQGTLIYQPYIRRSGETTLVAIKLNGWKKQIQEYISDYSELAEEVSKNKYKLEQLGEVISRYNTWKLGD